MPWRKILRIVYPIDLITFAYIFITGLFILLSAFKLPDINSHILARIGFVLVISSFIYLDNQYPNRIIRFFRHFYPLLLLGYFYPEIDYLNNVFFPNFDPDIANLEVTIFGGHPSIWFSQYMPWKWFNDLMSFGYLSYYFLIFLLAYWIYKYKYEKFSFVIFMICMSFYIYYFIFIVFPVAGPQFYLNPPYNQVPDAYIFRDFLKFVQSLGEKPAAAFPSSHVGITCVIIYLSVKFAPKLLKWYVPIGALLILSTVYIKAHYVLDVAAGFLSFPAIYWISSHTYAVILHGLSQEIRIQTIYEKLRTVVIRNFNNLNRKD